MKYFQVKNRGVSLDSPNLAKIEIFCKNYCLFVLRDELDASGDALIVRDVVYCDIILDIEGIFSVTLMATLPAHIFYLGRYFHLPGKSVSSLRAETRPFYEQLWCSFKI